jgi:hypothetical protein
MLQVFHLDDSTREREHLQYNFKINEVLIIDDSSSDIDRETMLIATQFCSRCTVVFKGT